MGGKKLSFTTRYVLLFGLLLLVANIALGLVVLEQSKAAMRTLVSKDMLDVVKSAAGSLDGDALAALTEDDVDGPVFRDIEDRLLVFQRSTDIHFIYAVKQVGEGQFVFTVDPDPVDPGEFGEETLTTPALVSAARGEATVDSEPAADRWGNFYSAYCPVFDSLGKVAGIVGVDFDAQWYDEQISRYSMSIVAVTIASVVVGSFAIIAMTSRVRRRFAELDDELSELSDAVDLLVDDMASYADVDAPQQPRQRQEPAVETSDTDELEILGNKIRAMQGEMRRYLDYLRAQAYIDPLTQMGSSSAYHEAAAAQDASIAQGNASFWVVVFDLNGLKELNDTYGHECGDQYIQGAARAAKAGMGASNVFRIGGDEFAAIVADCDQEHMDEALRRTDNAVASFNEGERPCSATLSMSKGVARYVPGKDASFKEVFARADRTMYENKREHYRAMGELPRNLRYDDTPSTFRQH